MGTCGSYADNLLVSLHLHLQWNWAVVWKFIQSVLSMVSVVYFRMCDLLTCVEGLLCSSHHQPPWWKSWIVTLSPLTGIRQYLKMALEVLGSAGHGLILAQRWWHSLQKIYMGVECYVGKTQHILILFIFLSWWHRRGGSDNDSSMDPDITLWIHGVPMCLSLLAFYGWWLVCQAGREAWHCSWTPHAVVHTGKFGVW